MGDSSSRKPGDFNDVQIEFNDPWDAVRGDPEGENNLISKTFGIKFVHYICLPDPLYNVKQGDIRQSFDHADMQQFADTDRFHRENEFLYIRKGEVFGIFQGNKKDLKSVAAGLYSDNGAMISINRHYIGTEEAVQISENDKLVPCELPSEFWTVNWQKFEHNPTGIDRMQFKVCSVVALIDNTGAMYFDGKDFVVEEGHVRWVDGGDRPGLDPITGQGRVCSIRYIYKPYYYIKTNLHDIRMRPQLDGQGNVTGKAGNVLALVQADWIYLDRRTASEKDEAAQLEEGQGDNEGPR